MLIIERRKTMKKILAMLLTLAMIFALCACGDSGSTNTPAPANEGTTEKAPAESSAPAEPEFILKIGHDQGEAHPYQNFAVAFKESLEEASNGRIQVDIYGAGVLGTETEMTQSLQLGTLDFLISTTANSSVIIPELGVLGMPFLYQSTEHGRAVCTDPDILSYWQDIVDNSNTGIVLLNIACSGWRNLYANYPINTLDDIVGKNVRTQSSEIETKMWKQLGANPVNMSFGEIYTSFETGLIDAAENCPTSYYTNAHHEVAPYYINSQHTLMIHPIMASQQIMDKLDDDLKAAVYEAAQVASDELFEAQMSADEMYLQKAIEEGVTYIEDFDMSPAYEACAPLHREFAESLGQSEALDAILALA